MRWIQSSQANAAFFDVESLPNVIQVVLNTDHPVHSYLWEIMHPDIDEMAEDEVRERLAKSAAAFRILIYSWARFEDEQSERDPRRVRDARVEWGKYAEEFFDEDDDSIPPQICCKVSWWMPLSPKATVFVPFLITPKKGQSSRLSSKSMHYDLCSTGFPRT